MALQNRRKWAQECGNSQACAHQIRTTPTARVCAMPPGFRRKEPLLLLLTASEARIAGGALSHSSYHPVHTAISPGESEANDDSRGARPGWKVADAVMRKRSLGPASKGILKERAKAMQSASATDRNTDPS